MAFLEQLEKEIQMMASQVPGKIGYFVKCIQTNQIVKNDDTHVFNSASVIKVPILCAAFEASRRGLIDLNKRIETTPETIFPGMGILNNLSPGLKPTIKDLMTLMIVISDNSATNMVIDEVGIDFINTFCEEKELLQTKLERKLFDKEGMKKGLNNYTTPKDMGFLLEGLLTKQLMLPEDCNAAIEILMRQQVNTKIPSKIIERWDLILGTNIWKVAHKTGDMPGIEHDVGVVFTERNEVVVAVMTEKTDNEKAIDFIGSLTKIALDFFERQ